MNKIFQNLKLHLLFFIFIKSNIFSFAQVLSPYYNVIDADKIDSFLKKEMKTLALPGLSFALFSDNEILYYNTLGVSNIETG